MEGTYREIESDLRLKAKEGDAAVAIQKDTLLARWCAFPFEPPLTITKTLYGEWGETLGTQLVYTAPTLDLDYETPMERALREWVRTEQAEIVDDEEGLSNRSCLIFYRQTTKRDVGARLAHVLREFNPWILPERVKAEHREREIKKAVNSGQRVILAPISKVSEGLNLKLDNAICYELGKNSKETNQGVLRNWRLGKRRKVKAAYFAGKDTAQHDKLRKQAAEHGAAALFGGDSPRGALASFGGADKVALAEVARRLETAEDLASAFARRREEWEEAVRDGGRTFIGYDHDPLPERVAAMRVLLAQEGAERTRAADEEEGRRRAALASSSIGSIGATTEPADEWSGTPGAVSPLFEPTSASPRSERGTESDKDSPAHREYPVMGVVLDWDRLREIERQNALTAPRRTRKTPSSSAQASLFDLTPDASSPANHLADDTYPEAEV